MTVEEVLEMKDPGDILEAIKHHPEIRTEEVRDHFAKISYSKFKANVIDSFGSFDPDMHYDFSRKK